MSRTPLVQLLVLVSGFQQHSDGRRKVQAQFFCPIYLD